VEEKESANLTKKDEFCAFAAGRVSVVTPVYNGEWYLDQMLNSVLAQDYPKIEMILVDDGSLDGTVAAAERFRDRFREKGWEYRIVRAEHKGAAGAINRGLEFVTGEYLIWPDADDVLEPESVRRRVEYLRTHPQYDCVRTLAYYFDAVTGSRRETADEKRGDLTKEDLFWDVLYSRTFVCCGCYMLRTASFFEIYPARRIPEYEVGQNFQMLLPFLYRHRCPTIQEELYGVCVREGSHSRTMLTKEQELKKYEDYEELIDEIAAICGICSQNEKDEINCWKMERRYRISLKYGQIKQAAAALWVLRRSGGYSAFGALKAGIWICISRSPLYRLCRRWLGRLFR